MLEYTTRFLLFASLFLMLSVAGISVALAGPGKHLDSSEGKAKVAKHKARAGGDKARKKGPRGPKKDMSKPDHRDKDERKARKDRKEHEGKKERKEREAKRGDKVRVCLAPGKSAKSHAIEVSHAALKTHLRKGACRTDALPGKACACEPGKDAPRPPHKDKHADEDEPKVDKEFYRAARDEKAKHIRRRAQLKRLGELAHTSKDAALLSKVESLTLKEAARHRAALKKLSKASR